MENKKMNFRTDMADERVSEYKKYNNLSEIDGVKVVEREDLATKITCVEVLNEQGEKALSKKIGKYISMEIDNVTYLEEDKKQQIIEDFSYIIKEIIAPYAHKSILIVGLGNKSVTPDSLGPKVTESLNITRHLFTYAKELVTEDMTEVSAISPGVLGTTGIEVAEIIHAIVKNTKPDLVIAVDSLASLSSSRVGKSIQISDTGIAPGSGVKNKRKELTEKTLKVPVIAIGIPMVVDMATITDESIKKVFDKLDIADLEDSYSVIAETLDTENYMVTPKEIDVIVDKLSEIVASSLNETLK